jgi:DNA-binding CsgD family transcriptional regulator
LPLRIEQAGRQLVIRLVVEQEQYLLLLEEQTLSLSKSLALLGLSQRETEVLFWVMQGKDNKAIALHLNVGKSTVGKHLERIYHKLGVQSRTEAIAQAINKLGLLDT